MNEPAFAASRVQVRRLSSQICRERNSECAKQDLLDRAETLLISCLLDEQMD